MAVFIISYDLRKPDYDYQPLYNALDEWGAKHIQDSVWGIQVDASAEQIFDDLWQHMHNAKDRLFVITFDKGQNYKAQNSINRLDSI